MKTLASLILCLAASLSAFQTAAYGDADSAASLIGEWRVVALVARGKQDSGVSFRGMRYKFDKEKWTTWAGSSTPAGLAGKPPMTLEYKVDNSQNPKHIDIIFKGKKASLTMKAIYKIQDGKLYICMGGIDRPKTFDTTGTKRGCYIAERILVPDTEGKP